MQFKGGLSSCNTVVMTVLTPAPPAATVAVLQVSDGGTHWHAGHHPARAEAADSRAGQLEVLLGEGLVRCLIKGLDWQLGSELLVDSKKAGAILEPFLLLQPASAIAAVAKSI